MAEPLAVEIERLVKEIERQKTVPDGEVREQISKALAKRFRVDLDEVAILVVVRNGNCCASSCRKSCGPSARFRSIAPRHSQRGPRASIAPK